MLATNERSTFAAAVDELRCAGTAMENVDVSGSELSEVTELTRVLRSVERRLEGVKVRLARRATELQAQGVIDDPTSVLLGTGQVSGHQARREAARADVASKLPALGEALQVGEVSGEHLDAVARVTKGLSPVEAHSLADLDRDLAAAASRLPVDTFGKKLRDLVDSVRNDHGLTRLEQQRARSMVKLWVDKNGMGNMFVRLDPERFAKVRTAVENESAALAAATAEPVSNRSHLQAAALVQLVERAQGAAGRPTVTVVVDAATVVSGPHEQSLSETVDGVPLPPVVIERFLCDAVTRAVVLDGDGLPLDVGRKQRTATPAQRAALAAIYRGCGWGDCSAPFSWCQVHHIHEWEHGGATNLCELLPLCSQHHHQVHEGGWRLRLLSDRTLEIHRPDPSGGPPDASSLFATAHPNRRRPKPDRGLR